MAAFSSRGAFVLPCSFVLALAACNSSKPSSQAHRADPGVRAEKPKKERPPVWQRDAIEMPEAFARFPVTSLDTLVGHWLVAGDIPGQRELWIIEEQGRKLTSIDVRGRERVHGLSWQSPCTLALTDEGGRTHTRRFMRIGERLFLHPEGAAAIAASDGSAIACIGTQAIVIPAEGPCVRYSEMLGVWSETGAPTETCVRELPPVVEGQPAASAELVIGERRLRAVAGSDGMWMDEALEQALAEKVADRAAGMQALAKPAPAP